MANQADFTIREVLDWARTKPAEQTYNFCDTDHCAVAQFGRETERPHLIGVGDLQPISRELWQAVIHQGKRPQQSFSDAGWTFGALAQRLEALLPAEPVTNWAIAETYLADIEHLRELQREKLS